MVLSGSPSPTTAEVIKLLPAHQSLKQRVGRIRLRSLANLLLIRIPARYLEADGHGASAAAGNSARGHSDVIVQPAVLANWSVNSMWPTKLTGPAC